MESHSATATVDAPEPSPVDNLPAPEAEHTSFADALETALEGLDAGGDGNEPPAPAPPAPETPAPETPAPEPVETTDKVEDTRSTEEDAATEVDTETDLLESLTEDVGDDWTPKAASRFKQLKSELKTNRSELDQMRQTIKEQESKIQEMSGLVENRDIDQLQERIAHYEKEKAFTDLEATTAYRDAVGEPLEKLLNAAGDIAAHYDVSNDALVDVMSIDKQDEQDEALNELLPNVSDRDRARLYRIIEDIDPILERRSHLVANAEAALKEAQMLEEQQRNVKAAEQAQIRNNITRNVAQRVSEKLPFLNGIDNFDMEAIQAKAAEKDPSVVHPVDFAYNAVAAQLLPTIVREYISSRKEAEALTEKLAEYEEAEPTMSGTPTVDGVKRAADNVSFTDAINAALGG